MLTAPQFDLTCWDLNAIIESEAISSHLNMNEALHEVNQMPSSSASAPPTALPSEDSAIRSTASTISPRINMTKEEVTAAEAVATLAAKEVTDSRNYGNNHIPRNIHQGDESNHSTSCDNSTSSKRDRSELEEAQPVSPAQAITADISTQAASTSPTYTPAEKERQKIARLDGHVPTQYAAAPTSALQQEPLYQQLQPLVPKPPTLTVQQQPAESSSSNERPMRPFPYFYYRDFRDMPDPDPLTPLTAPGRVPNFPAKMHSILCRSDLVDIVSWMPHGRAWRVLKPREFEVRVIPTYFEHAKFSSFIRQANGWGFRRITQGKDRNAYYHEMFLRGLPHLCKMMKRPGVSEKLALDPDQEPDFYKIAEESPVPERAEDDSILLQCTLQGGPKARMPIYFGTGGAHSLHAGGPIPSAPAHHSAAPPQVHHHHYPEHTPAPPRQLTSSVPPSHEMYALPSGSIPQMTDLKIPAGFASSHSSSASGGSTPSHDALTYLQALTPLPLSHEGASSTTSQGSFQAAGNHVPDPLKGLNMPDPSSSASAQFAAGFAAAAALSQQQFQALLGQALAGVPNDRSTSTTGHQSSNSSVSDGPAAAPATVTTHAQHPVPGQESHHQHHPPPAPIAVHYPTGPAQAWKDIVPAPVQAIHHTVPQQHYYQHQVYHYPQQHPPSPPPPPQHHQYHHQAAPQHDYRHQPPPQPYHHHHHHGAAQPGSPAHPSHYVVAHAPAHQQHQSVEQHQHRPQH